MREARAEQVAFVIHEHLGLVFEPAERRRMDDAVAVALEFGARAGRRFRIAAAARSRGVGRVRREMCFQRVLREHGARRRTRLPFMLYVVAAPVCHRFLRNVGGAL